VAIVNKAKGPKAPPNNGAFNPRMSVMEIDVKDLNTFVYTRGVRAKVYKTLWCPNVKSIDGAEHNIDCPLCHGTSFLDLDPISTHVAFQGQQKEHSISPENLGSNWEEATTMATFLSGVELSYYTKVVLPDFTHITKELVQRQATGLDSPIVSAFTITSYTASTGQVLIPDSVDLLNVRINDILIDVLGTKFIIESDINNTTGSKGFKVKLNNKVMNLGLGAQIIRGDIDRLQYSAVSVDIVIDNVGNRYYADKDYVIDRNGDLAWLSLPSSQKPINGSIYTVHYNTLVAYRAIRALHSNRYSTMQQKTPEIENVEYPQQWVLKKLFLFDKKDSETGLQLLPDPIKNPSITTPTNEVLLDNNNAWLLEDGSGNVIVEEG
jgi:hypothetical protein